MIEKFADLTNEFVKTPVPNQFQEQRQRLDHFYEQFSTKLRHIRNEMGGELGTLKSREFDHKMFKLFADVYSNVIDLYKAISPEKPYIAAEKLVHYVLDRPSSLYIDNLDFLAKHHLKQTNVDFKPSKVMVHPEIRSLDKLKELALELRVFMSQHPLVRVPEPSSPPAPGLPAIVKDLGLPSEPKPGQNDVTNPGVPLAKKLKPL